MTLTWRLNFGRGREEEEEEEGVSMGWMDWEKGEIDSWNIGERDEGEKDGEEEKDGVEEIGEEDNSKTDKDYVSVIKKVKKDRTKQPQ